MAFYADLGPIDYFGEEGRPSWRAVGWLGEGHPFSQGEVSPTFFERLCVLLLEPWQPFLFMGPHRCDLCPWEVMPGPDPGKTFSAQDRRRRILGARKTPERIRVGRKDVSIGTRNLWVPAKECVYVTPSMIAHYIRDHGYRPPDEFIAAVLSCPSTCAPEYRDALRAVDPVLARQWRPR